jgi:Holliday junction resolvase
MSVKSVQIVDPTTGRVLRELPINIRGLMGVSGFRSSDSGRMLLEGFIASRNTSVTIEVKTDEKGKFYLSTETRSTGGL